MTDLYATTSTLDWFNVKSYGAKGNGSTLDDTAVQAAQAAAAAAGGVVYFPAGTYNLSSALTVSNKVAYVGDGDTVSIIKQTSTSANVFTGTDVQNVTIADLGITGPGSGTGTGVKFALVSNTATLYVTMRNVTVTGFGSDGINMQIPIVSSFDRVVAQSCGGWGFNLYGVTTGAGSPGTSCSLRACYANGNTTGGFRLYKLSYTALAACAADNNPIGYLIDQGWNVALTACGSEGNTTGTKINGGYGNTVFSQFVYNNRGTGIWVTGTAHLTGLYQVADVTPGTGATNFLKVDSGSYCTIVGQSNTTANAFNGTVTILDDGGNGIVVPGHAYFSGQVEINNTLAMDGHKITSVANGTAVDDAAAYGQLAAYLPLAGGTLTGALTATAFTSTSTSTLANLRLGTGQTFGGASGGAMAIANATTTPTQNPSNGTVVYAQGGVPMARTSAGQTINMATFARNDVGFYVPPAWGQFWRAKRDAAGTGLATVAAVGSSSTQGLYSSNLLTAPFASKIMTSLQSSYGDGGSGYFSTARSLTFMGASTTANAWAALSGNFASVTGSWSVGNIYGPGANYLFSSTNGNSITFQTRGTKIRVYTLSGAGRVNWTYSVDGGSAVSVTDSGTAGSTIQVTAISGLSSSTHTITITHNGTTGNYLSVCGVTGENATGVVVNNYGISGASSSTFTDFTNNYGAGRWCGGPDYPADLVIYAAGANDANAGMSGDTWAANLRQFLAGVRDGTSVGGTAATGTTDVLVVMQHIGSYDTTNLKWQDYTARGRDIADAYGAAFVDMWPMGRNSWNYWNSLGYWGNSGATGGVAGTDTIHMSDAGHAAIANAILPILTS
ncbi:lysophospholipase L1-like esterase [Streptomyces sp. Ag109_O5-1]|uniref:glycosyl hydrolase family 28-related protein n=1 Tax=Streptomyces sp. Ag109_O5-1 TaxID=1938851 RepID=UPI000F4F8601|nr:glycosyl hydrolase family 28-related protein [Streptomyces sp. Ag109_O5-1]RPE39734.1 lysophospholipase L1-like esterase [Streptomyces sp. Ag109_O5-1]